MHCAGWSLGIKSRLNNIIRCSAFLCYPLSLTPYSTMPWRRRVATHLARGTTLGVSVLSDHIHTQPHTNTNTLAATTTLGHSHACHPTRLRPLTPQRWTRARWVPASSWCEVLVAEDLTSLRRCCPSEARLKCEFWSLQVGVHFVVISLKRCVCLCVCVRAGLQRVLGPLQGQRFIETLKWLPSVMESLSANQ